ncbi:MAG: hypothetical protein KatS3mg058_1641 [Roseiflexus sp.]|nr:MAG: hypothetical protein KatS3mg058_1641 [Roseiflexus sp.]
MGLAVVPGSQYSVLSARFYLQSLRIDTALQVLMRRAALELYQ